jgi:endoglucanase
MYGAVSEAGVTVRTSVYAASDTAWTESGLTWNIRPPAGTTALATASTTGDADRWIEWDLTAFLRSEVAAGRRVVTLVLRNLDASPAALNLASEEAATNRPELVVTP